MMYGDFCTGSWLFLLGVLLTGCGRGPTGVVAPQWDAAAAAERAFSEYDSNHDNKLSRVELKKCAGLSSALQVFDADGDGAISTNELAAKLQEIREQQAALVEVTCSVTRGGRPLEGATVTFVPEAFMGPDFKPASGVTGVDGIAFPSIAEDELPKELRGRVHGVRCGVFRVAVTHPQVDIPPKYNAQTKVGRTVSRREHEPVTIRL